ncbi:MAG: glyoxylate/hydroxypyruvate reductase A [Paracoccaceae bacterium]|nr:glyoxylate/hydroxypyruvate reductase A [Paracoccaceae bacterium]
MIHILFAAAEALWVDYEAVLRDALDAHGLTYMLDTDLPPEVVDYIIYAPNSPLQDFTPYTRLKAVLNLWAGVEAVVGNETLKVPLARMVDDEGLTAGMVQWVTGHVLRHHLGMDAQIVNPDHVWQPKVPPLTTERPVTILGMGALGQACAAALVGLGFPVRGWSRSPRDVPGVTCLHGKPGLIDALRGAEVVVLLLPDTPATQNVLDAKRLGLLSPGAFVINPGRGALIEDQALLAALDSGQVAHATLDVFRVEPLPADHAFWAHPRVTVTPHIAADTRPASAAKVVAENIHRSETGQPLLHLVDRAAGY